MQDGVPSDAVETAAGRWQLHDIDRALRLLALLGLAAAVVLTLAYIAPEADELLKGASDGR